MNIDPKYIDLMNAEIDGVNSKQESEELQAFLSASPEAQNHFDQLKKIAGMLDELDEVAPPADLRTGVLTAIGRPEPTVVHFPVTGARAALRYVYAAAAGVILGVFGFYWATSDGMGVDPNHVGAVMAPHGVATKPPETEEEFPLNFEGVTGIARLESVDKGFSLEIDLSSDVPVSVVLDFSPEEVQFRGFFSDLGEIDSLEVATTQVRWVHQSRDPVVFSLDTRGSTGTSLVEMTFSVDGTEAHKLTVGLPGSG